MTSHTSIKKLFVAFILVLVAIFIVGCDGTNEAEPLLDEIAFAKLEDINGSFPLPKYVKGRKEAPINWTSNNPAIKIEEYPAWDDSFNHDLYLKANVELSKDPVEVTLTAEVTYNKQKAKRDFVLKIVGDDYTAMTITEAKAAAIDTKVKIRGIVSFVVEKGGYAIVAEDGSDQMYIYQGSGFKVGDVVVVRGATSVYNKMPQIGKGSAAEKVDQVEFDVEKEATKMTLKQVMNMDPTDKKTYSKLIQIEGIVKETSDPNKPYMIVNPVDGRDFVFVTKYTSTKSLETLKANKEKFVKINTIVYDNRDNVISIVVPDEFTGTEFTYTDETSAELTLTELQAQFEGMLVTGDLTLPTANQDRNATIAWTSGTPSIISNEGKVTLPNADTKVTLTIKVTIGAVTKEGTVEVTVKKLDISKIKDVFAKTPKSSNDPTIFVAVEGLVIGH